MFSWCFCSACFNDVMIAKSLRIWIYSWAAAEIDHGLGFQAGTRCNLYVILGPLPKITSLLVFTLPALPATDTAACELLAGDGGGGGAPEESRAAEVRG